MEYIKVVLLDLPVTVDGLTIYNDDDSFTIFINARLNHENQCKAYDHEMAHINNRDFEKMTPADRLEAYAHMLSA